MKTLKLAALAVAVLSATSFSSLVQAEVSANFGATSNYIWRGMSQSSNDVSVSGGIDYSDESGFYAGTWVGSIDWGNGDGTENDFYLGYGGESGDFGYDVGYIYYMYPATGFEDSDFGEIYFNGTYKAFSFGVAYTVNSQYDDDAPYGTGDLYYSVGYGIDLPNEFGLGLTYGYYDFDSDDEVYGDVDFGHFQIDLSKGDFTLSLSKADDESGDDDTKFVVSWGTSF
ncbi:MULTISPECIES: TorF family putative porin [Alteromonadaceae]|uniref:TorF family putative porin n=1 Tax=Alteromonadaceae TaxID=72275 RepID=UPI001C08BCB8|nr:MULTISPECIES: TorF family putative porin [Aliiglaciecola]MBU2878537.1 TorF family putative porin [Aliiglaciecola lipolytica]MDO6709635.1 TorF family putative porin [Aliiglaciecola sp. 2_MG-2023]MDO6750823.1 TorF family putative porin [Aliiglaciecola sp. 1_MG-2023]